MILAVEADGEVATRPPASPATRLPVLSARAKMIVR
jgi:hypothetical protein